MKVESENLLKLVSTHLQLEEVKKTEGGESPIDYTDKLMDTPDGSPKSESSQSSGEGADTDDCKVLRTKLKLVTFNLFERITSF